MGMADDEPVIATRQNQLALMVMMEILEAPP
jgi:hypothetical protein